MNQLPHLMHGRPFAGDFKETTQPHPLRDEQLDLFESPAYASLTSVQPGTRERRILRPVY